MIKTIATALASGILVLGASFMRTEMRLGAVDDHLKLKANATDILAADDTDQVVCGKPHGTDPGACVTVGRMKTYAYVSDTLAAEVHDNGRDEDISKRTENKITFTDGSIRIYAGKPFHKKGNEWRTVEFATTTIDAFDLQATPILEQALGIQHAYADNLQKYSGAGDGYVERTAAPVETWATIRSGAGVTADYTTTPIYMRNQRGSGGYNLLSRAVFQFDTSSLGTAAIASSTIYIHSDSGNTITSGSCGVNTTYLNFYTVTTASQTTLSTGDFALANFGTTPLTSTTTYATWDANVYQSKQLNAYGVAAINKAGYTSIAAMTDADRYNVDAGCADFSYNIYGIDMSEAAGTSEDPYIEIQFTPAATTTPLMIRGATLRINGSTLINTN